jgi:Na+-translocating ferredoxin:NAD+ oxidoreductase RnfG subunit
MEKNDQLFIQLLYIFHASAMQALGKIKSPISGKIEKNLEQAKQSIDMLEMLKTKTANNLSEELIKALDTFLTEVRLNYVEEMNKN